MQLDYEPLLRIQREIQGMPRGMERFRQYLRTIWNCYETDFELIPLMIANPMGKDHVTALLDQLLALDADGIAKDAAREAAAKLADLPGEYKAAVVVADDCMGGWTNRYDYEFKLRFGWDCVRDGTKPTSPVEIHPPKWSKYFWVTGVLWSSEGPSRQAVREAMLTAAYRTAFVARNGPARTLRDMLHQEGHVMAMAGCAGPVLDLEEIAYTREVLAPCLDADDMRTCVECLFGDEAGRTLGFTPRGLSHWAGLSLAFHDARSGGLPEA
ncbi:MAG: hypothetical protein ACLQIB_10935 [Isosphaeraceae bacterium]